MTPAQPAKTWQEMTSVEKRQAVKLRIAAGATYSKIADAIGAPNRYCVAGVVNRLRQIGELPPAPSKQETGAVGGAVGRLKARARREGMPAFHAGNIANKAESRKVDPGISITITRAAAFDPIPGIEPIGFMQLGPRTCRWPVDGVDGREFLFCGAACEFEDSYCRSHKALAYAPPTDRQRAGLRSAERIR